MYIVPWQACPCCVQLLTRHSLSVMLPDCQQAVIHCEIIRQAAQVVAMDHELLRSGDRACVRFRWDMMYKDLGERGKGV